MREAEADQEHGQQRAPPAKLFSGRKDSEHQNVLVKNEKQRIGKTKRIKETEKSSYQPSSTYSRHANLSLAYGSMKSKCFKFCPAQSVYLHQDDSGWAGNCSTSYQDGWQILRTSCGLVESREQTSGSRYYRIRDMVLRGLCT